MKNHTANTLVALYQRMKYSPLAILATATVISGCSAPKPDIETAATVSINENIRYQIIQGFGGFGAQKVWWADAPFFNQEFVELIINDLGVSILRDNIPIAFEPQNDNEDPFVIDWSGFNHSQHHPGADSHLGEHFPYLKAMYQAGLEKLIVSVWSPPIWMKYNNHRGNGSDTIERRTDAPPYTSSPTENTNQLRTDLYEEFAEYCVAYIRILKRETGIDLYALSLQNEPRFSQFYASAVYSPQSLKDLIKVVGNRFKREGIDTKIFMPEDVQSLDKIFGYLNAVFEDEEAAQFTDIVAIHNYRGDGVNAADSSPTRWRKTAELALAHDKEMWMTETSGYDPTSFDGGMKLAKSIYTALHYGHVSAWVYWQMSGKDLIDANGKKTYLYFISQHFYKHIRPGAERIEISSNNEDLLALAFSQPAAHQRTLIFINDGDTQIDVSVEGLPTAYTFEVRVTSQDLFYQQRNELYQNGRYLIPEKSIVTLVSNDNPENL